MLTRMLRKLGAALALAATPAMAADMIVRDCSYVGDMRNVAEPWEDNTRTFYNNRVRVVLADTIEPACCALQLVILMPDQESELGDRKCVAIGGREGGGFSGLEFDKLTADYDPTIGLTLRLSYRLYDHDIGASGRLRTGRVILNLSDGSVRTD